MRNQPPICALVLPPRKLTTLYSLKNSRISFMPLPCSIQAFCWRAVRPNGTVVSKHSVGFLPK
ncbi:hypothetical protein D9M69_632380 [compost metagenome]